MDHLAQAGLHLPDAGARRARARPCARWPAGRPRSSPSSRASGCAGRRPRHCAAVGEAMARMHLAGGRLHAAPHQRARRCAGWRPLFERFRARADEIAPGLAAVIEQELAHQEAHWPADLPQGVIHADLFPDNVFFLGDALSGADRLLLRLQRRARLRRRRGAERLVLRDRSLLQHHQGPGAAQGLPKRAPDQPARARGTAAAGARLGAALPADARLRLAAHAARMPW